MHLHTPKCIFRLVLIAIGLSCTIPAISNAALCGGGTTTTMVLTYTYGSPPRWVARIDPPNVKGFQLTILFDSNRVMLPTLIPKSPFNVQIMPVSGGVQVTGNTLVTSPGDVDIFELVFIDKSPPSPEVGPFAAHRAPQASATTKSGAVAVNHPAGSNSDLSDLVLSGGPLTPAFDSGTTSYTANVPNATTSTTVTPTVADATATVTVNGSPVVSGTPSGAIPLAVGMNTITTVVTSGSGTTMTTYTVVVTRSPSTSIEGVQVRGDAHRHRLH